MCNVRPDPEDVELMQLISMCFAPQLSHDATFGEPSLSPDVLASPAPANSYWEGTVYV